MRLGCLLIFFAVGIVSAQGADVSRKGDGYTLIGTIAPGDAEKVSEMLPPADHEQWSYPGDVLSLEGQGGDFEEALAIANLLHDRAVATVVKSGTRCTDACAIAFLGGTRRLTEHEYDEVVLNLGPSRLLEQGAILAFAPPKPNFVGSVTGNDVQVAYDRAVSIVVKILNAEDTLNLDSSMMAQWLHIEENDYNIVETVDDVGVLNIAVASNIPSMITGEMMVHFCANRMTWNTGGSAVEAADIPLAEAERSNWTLEQGGWNLVGRFYENARRYVVPLEDSEDGFRFCLIEQNLDNQLELICVGELTENSVDAARELGTQGYVDEPASCLFPELGNPGTLVGFDFIHSPVASWALLHPTTKLVDVNFELNRLVNEARFSNSKSIGKYE